MQASSMFLESCENTSSLSLVGEVKVRVLLMLLYAVFFSVLELETRAARHCRPCLNTVTAGQRSPRSRRAALASLWTPSSTSPAGAEQVPGRRAAPAGGDLRPHIGSRRGAGRAFAGSGERSAAWPQAARGAGTATACSASPSEPSSAVPPDGASALRSRVPPARSAPGFSSRVPPVSQSLSPGGAPASASVSRR